MIKIFTMRTESLFVDIFRHDKYSGFFTQSKNLYKKDGLKILVCPIMQNIYYKKFLHYVDLHNNRFVLFLNPHVLKSLPLPEYPFLYQEDS